jgi:mediator of RNA polymerase II transcription subunit 14
MPGVIMENGSRNGGHTNHDRDTITNGANGAGYASEKAVERAKDRAESQLGQNRLAIANGINGAIPQVPSQQQTRAGELILNDMADRIRQLPPEINHITEGFEPLSRLLTRLAQVTHNRLLAKIQELAAMPTPPPAVNGNSMHHVNNPDDNLVENIKKVNLLKFAEETHANWTKALVITQWSCVSEDVGKLIDLKVHLDSQRLLYETALYDLSEAKRSLINARVPNPDLRTAVEVLSTGKASWMPDVCSFLF